MGKFKFAQAQSIPYTGVAGVRLCNLQIYKRSVQIHKIRDLKLSSITNIYRN